MTVPQYGNPKRYQQPRKAQHAGEKKVAMSATPSDIIQIIVPGQLTTRLGHKAIQKIKKSKTRHKTKTDKAKMGYNKPPSSVRLD